MKVDTSAVLLAIVGVAAARPDAVRSRSPRSIHTHARAHMRREVPRKHIPPLNTKILATHD
jgi:hypothetical protein